VWLLTKETATIGRMSGKAFCPISRGRPDTVVVFGASATDCRLVGDREYATSGSFYGARVGMNLRQNARIKGGEEAPGFAPSSRVAPAMSQDKWYSQHPARNN